MKRVATHYLYLPSHGFLKQYVVEIDEEGVVATLFPLDGESESVVWLPGVIVLVSQDRLDSYGVDFPLEGEELAAFINFNSIADHQVCTDEYTSQKYIAFRLYPFDYVQMKPLLHTKMQRLIDYIY